MKKCVKFLIVFVAIVFAFAFTGCLDCECPSESKDVPAVIDGMEYVKGGTFWMGSTMGDDDEKPVHEVTVSSFYMGKYEVTQAEYEKVMGSTPSKFKGNQRPVESVSWYDAVNYCNKRSKAEGLKPCYTINRKNVTLNLEANGYRLPTEAEWEYAAKGGSHKSAFNYSGSDNIDKVAWYDEDWDRGGTHEVGKKKANALGLYDMSGNVDEWCWDWYDKNYYGSSPAKDSLGPVSGSLRVIRGGSWRYDTSYCRCACRYYFNPDDRDDDVGFRVVRSGK